MPFLADLHGAADAVVLLLHPVNVLLFAGHKAGGGGFQRLRAAIDHQVRAQSDVLAEVFLCCRIHHQGQAVPVGNVPQTSSETMPFCTQWWLFT